MHTEVDVIETETLQQRRVLLKLTKKSRFLNRALEQFQHRALVFGLLSPTNPFGFPSKVVTIFLCVC